MSPKLALAAGFFAVLVIIALIQGLVVHKIGFGPLSVEFGSSETVPGTPSTAGGPGSGPGPQPDAKETDFDKAKSVTGSWKKTNGTLTLEVVRVDQQDGRIRLTVKARNTGGNAINLPLFGNFVATDDTSRTYDARFGPDTEWPQNVPGGQTVTGPIDLDGTVGDGARKLSISFSIILGFNAPFGSITVPGIPIPR